MMRRPLLFLLLVALAGCTKAMVTRIDSRTFAIQGPGVPGGSSATNVHLAHQLCPGGYRVLDEITRRNTPDGYRLEIGDDYTKWVIRCI